jgi:hypothetical protein
VVGACFRAAYAIYAHSAVARGAGVTEDQIATITAGKRPADLSEEEQVAYEVAVSPMLTNRSSPRLRVILGVVNDVQQRGHPIAVSPR